MRKRVIIVIAIMLLIISGKFLVQFASFAPVLFQYFFNKEITLKQKDNRINILLLGIGGGKHEGPNLTDTIIFASVDPSKDKVTLVSIPRDLWAPDLRAKINTAYAFGEGKEKGGGLKLAKAAVGKIVNQDVTYGILVDFEGFVKAVDLIGGINFTVDTAFDDYEYPIEGKENDLCGHTEEELPLLATMSSQLEAFPCRYSHIHFDKGETHMDGKTALQFVRSRHAKGDEGTDFARSKRQEKVIAAVKTKVFSIQTLLNPIKLISLYEAMRDNIDTDINQSEFDDFAKLAQQEKDAKLTTLVIDYGDEKTKRPGLLINPQISEAYENQWVLIPRVGNGNFAEIQKIVSCEITKANCSISPTVKPQ